MDHPLSAAPCAFGRRSTLAIGLILGLAGTSSTHAQTPGFHLVGVAPNNLVSTATGLSADGRVVTGYSSPGVQPGFVWSETTGRYDFGEDADALGCFASAISGDGTTVTGSRGNNQAFRWSGPGTAQILGFLPTYDRSVGTAVSGDGSIVVGHAYSSTQARSQAFRWTAGTGMVGLGFTGPDDIESEATDISRDGGTIVGWSLDGPSGSQDAFAWTASAGFRVLPRLPGAMFGGRADGVNHDGTIIVGYDGGFRRGVMWTGSSVMDLGIATGWTGSLAKVVSDDGSVVLGGLFTPTLDIPAVWTPTTGFVPFADYLALHGITIPDGYSIREVTDMSDDGRTFCGNLFVGTTRLEGFVVTVPAPGACALVLAVASLSAARRTRK